MTWHASTAQIDRYVSGAVKVSDAMSLEAHLPECARCRHLLARRSDRDRLDANWAIIETQLGLSTDTVAPIEPAQEQAPPHSEVAGPETTRAVPPSRRWRPSVALGLAFVVAAVLGVAAVLVARSFGSDPFVADDPTTTISPSTSVTESPTSVAPTTTNTTSAVSTTAPPAAESTTTTLLPELPAELSMTWERVPPSATLENAWMAAVVPGGPGLVAVGGTTGEQDAAAWVSVDGVDWERIESETFRGSEEQSERDGDQAMNDIVTSPFGLVAVGVDELVVSESRRAAVWISPDGRSWARVTPDDPVFADAEMTGVVAAGPGLVAFGKSDDTTAVWVSEDAMTWSRSIDEDLAANAITWMDLAGNDRTIVGVGYRTIGELTGFNQLPSGGIVPAVWTSTDGLTWNPVPEGAIPLDPEETQLDGIGAWMQSITVTVEGFLVVGSSTWTSVDGIVWDRVERAVLGEQPGFVYEVGAAVGFFGDRVLSYFFLEDTLWGSRDGGVTWHDVAQFDGGYFEIDGPGLPKAFSTITDIIDAGPLVAVGSVVTYSSSEDIGGECLGDTSGGSCRSDAAVFIGTWEESGS